jgi:hypothetical protein
MTNIQSITKPGRAGASRGGGGRYAAALCPRGDFAPGVDASARGGLQGGGCKAARGKQGRKRGNDGLGRYQRFNDHPSNHRQAQWLEWLEGDAWRARAGGGGGLSNNEQRPHSGLLLKNSVVISMPDYLRGLWLATEEEGQRLGVAVRWEKATAASLGELLRGNDAVVLASGAGIRCVRGLIACMHGGERAN